MGFPVVNDPNSTVSDYDPDYPIVREDADTMRRYRSIGYPGGKNEKEKHSEHIDFIFEQPIQDTLLKLHVYQTLQDEENYWYALGSNGTLSQSYSGGGGREDRQKGLIARYRLNLWEDNTLTVGYDQRRIETGEREDIWRIHAGYFDDMWAISPKLTLNLGLRYSYIREYTYPYTDPNTGITDRFLMHHEFWLPKSTLSYSFSPETKAYVSINREIHTPGC